MEYIDLVEQKILKKDYRIITLLIVIKWKLYMFMKRKTVKK